MLQIGIKGTTEKTVTQEMSAKNAGSGDSMYTPRLR